MKALVFLLTVLALIWLIRQSATRRRAPRDASGSPQRRSATSARSTPQTMVQCLQCGVHLPADEAIAGRLGPYCSDAHRQTREGG